jgi:hypothetical protein
VKAMIVSLVNVGNAIKVGNSNTISVVPELVDVARSYFVGIFLISSIKVSIYLFEIFIFQTIKKLRFDFLISSFF